MNEPNETAAARLLRARDVAKLLQVHVATVYQMVHDGRFPPPLEIPGITRWAPQTVMAWIAERDAAANGQSSD